MSGFENLYSIVWSVKGREERHILSDYPVFIGRLGKKPPSLGSFNPLKVYIYHEKSGKIRYTGIASIAVSRYHVKLEAGEEGIYLIDHGPEGKGSKNGTYLNGERLEPGERVLLRPGDSFQLGRSGPVFTLTVVAGKKEAIVLREGVPAIMPKPIAEKLATAPGIEVKSYDESTAMVVPKTSQDKITAGDLVVHLEKLPERMRELRTLTFMEQVVTDAIELIQNGYESEKLRTILAKLELDIYRDTLIRIGGENVKQAYNQLLDLIRVGGLSDTGILEQRLQEFRSLLRELLRTIM